jgi:hypothetical protein
MKTSEMVFEYLKNQGLMPRIDDDNDIIFKYQMLTFIYFNNDEDEMFFRLALPGIFDVTDENRVTVLEAMNEVNKGMKVAKAYIPREDVWLATEIMMDSTPVLGDMVPRLLNILLHSREEFYKQIG